MNEQEQILQYIEERKDELIEFVGNLIRTRSHNPGGNEVNVARLIRDQIGALNLGSVEEYAAQPDRPNLIYRREGQHPQGIRIMFNGHMDTKPPGILSEWRTDPYEPVIKDGKLYGLGACDMKGALGAMVYAFAAVNALNITSPGTLTLALTCDEEAGSSFGAQYLVENSLAMDADYVIIGEPSGVKEDWEGLHIISRGVFCFKIKVFGDQTHSSLSDHLGSVNAAVKMGKVLAEFKSRLKLSYPPNPYCPGGPTVNPGVMLTGGVYYGVNPGYVEFHCDIRTLPGMTKERGLKDIQALLDSLMAEDPELKVEVEEADPPLDWIPPTQVDENMEVVQSLLRSADQVLGYRPPIQAFPGGTDAAYFQAKGGIPTIPSFGPGLLTCAHSPNEYVTVKSIVQAAKIYALTAWDLVGRIKK